MEGLQLIATGEALPSRLVTNDDLSKLVDTSDEWITTRTGIRERHFCAEGENAATLAVAAARQALECSGLQPEQIGCCVCATLSGLYATPSTACLVQRELGLAQDIPVLDVNAACSGFIYGAAVALAERFQNVTFAPMAMPVLFNCLGHEKAPGDSIADLLVRQVQSSVYQEDTIRRLADLGVDTVVEIGPGKAISGFVKKTVGSSMTCLNIETAADFEKVLAALKEAQA